MNWMKSIIQHLEETVAAVLLGVMVIIVAIDVFGRYVLNHPLQGAGEIARLLFVWQVFLASAGALDRGLHVGIEFIVDRFSLRIRAVIDLFVNMVVLIMIVIVGYMGWELAFASVTKRFQMLDMPYTYALLGIPVGCFLMGIHLFANIVRAAKGAKHNTYRIERKGFAGTGCVMPEENLPSSEGV
jgi:TRAP-type C4-dicarboxylate transport system permease small subunit